MIVLNSIPSCILKQKKFQEDKMKKRALALFLAVCILTSLTAISASAEAAADIPINAMSDYESLVSAQPTILLNDVPEDAEDVSYGWLNNIPAIDQIDFTYDGHTYCYRAAACPNGTTSVDISGVTEMFPSVTSVDVSTENQAGGSYVLRYDAESGKGVANWTSEMAATQYSLYSEDACKGEKLEEMPFVELMDMLFIYMQDAKTVSGTVTAVNSNALALNLTDGSSVVLNCEHIKTITVKANDTVDVFYLGEIDGDSDVVKIVENDGEVSTLSGDTFSGIIFRYIDNCIYVLTADDNVFPFEITSSTVISGASSVLAENENVIVTYTGDLYGDPVALEVNITNAVATPSPTAVPTASPIYTDRYVEGIVTAVGGIWVTVNGTVFTVNGADCYISGTPKVGSYANINYRDYGGNKIVTAAYFADLPAPGPVPTPVPTSAPIYVDRYIEGYVTSVGGVWVTVNGIVFTVNGADCYLSGQPKVGSYAKISYRDYGSRTEVTSAYFIDMSTPTPRPTPEPTPRFVGPVGAGWTCTFCGTRNGVYDVYCSGCGTSRSGTGHIGDVLY